LFYDNANSTTKPTPTFQLEQTDQTTAQMANKPISNQQSNRSIKTKARQ